MTRAFERIFQFSGQRGKPDLDVVWKPPGPLRAITQLEHCAIRKHDDAPLYSCGKKEERIRANLVEFCSCLLPTASDAAAG